MLDFLGSGLADVHDAYIEVEVNVGQRVIAVYRDTGILNPGYRDHHSMTLRALGVELHANLDFDIFREHLARDFLLARFVTQSVSFLGRD